MYYADFLQYVNQKDSYSGKVGDACELAFKSYTSGRTVKKRRPAGKKDAYVTFVVEGKRRSVTVEVKVGCGRVDHCCESDFIAYWPEPTEDASLEDGMVVFPRAAFAEMLNGYPGRGSMLKPRKDGKVHIQSFRGLLTGARPGASVPLAEWIYACCENQPTVREWLKELRG